MKQVLVLGTGCAKCKLLEEKVRQAIAQHGIAAEVSKVAEIKDIMKYGILSTPGLVIDGVVKWSGGIPKDEQIVQWLQGGA